MQNRYSFFLTTTPGLEDLLIAELHSFGYDEVKATNGGVWLEGSLEAAYRASLWSRIASRVMLKLAEFPIDCESDLYDQANEIDWQDHFSTEATFSVRCTGRSQFHNHSGFAALRVKDAIVDHFREAGGQRPSVDTEDADIRVSLFLRKTTGTIYLDLSGGTLQMRGYRTEAGEAPLKEHLAAAILLRANWPELAAGGGTLVDPMCGSGTFLIEGALIAADIAPGLYRNRFGFQQWRQHDEKLWQQLVSEARDRRDAGIERLSQIVGYDESHLMVSISKANIERAGLKGKIIVARQGLAYLENVTAGSKTGLMVTNPPYGERLGEIEELAPLYRTLGERLIHHFDGWQVAVLMGNPQLGTHIGLEAKKKNKLKNGPIQCQLLQFAVDSEEAKARAEKPKAELSPQAKMLADRLRKNLKRLGKWARKKGVGCYRLYDADIPEYAAAIDIYGSDVHIQEYQAPKEIETTKAAKRMREIKRVTAEVLDRSDEQIFLKVRSRQRGRDQYEKRADEAAVRWVEEGGLKFQVNLSEYLDTGLFLDHRPIRRSIQQRSEGLCFLNLFAYTSTVSVHAAAGGALRTTSVDLSATYLEWAGQNFAENGLQAAMIDERREPVRCDEAHLLVQADVLEWLKRPQGEYDLIFCDPPTFSNSKRMDDVFDVQRDHVELIERAMALLAPGGELIFSNNFKKFKIDGELLVRFNVKEITAETLDEDFARNRKIHRCWRFVKDGI